MTWVDNKNFKHKRETMDYRKQMREEDKQFLKKYYKEHKITQTKIPVAPEDKNDPYFKPEYIIFMDGVEIGQIRYGWGRLGGWGWEIHSEKFGDRGVSRSSTVKDAKRALVSKAVREKNQ